MQVKIAKTILKLSKEILLSKSIPNKTNVVKYLIATIDDVIKRVQNSNLPPEIKIQQINRLENGKNLDEKYQFQIYQSVAHYLNDDKYPFVNIKDNKTIIDPYDKNEYPISYTVEWHGKYSSEKRTLPPDKVKELRTIYRDAKQKIETKKILMSDVKRNLYAYRKNEAGLNNSITVLVDGRKFLYNIQMDEKEDTINLIINTLIDRTT